MVAKRLTSQEGLSWADDIPGRLLWIRMHSNHRDYDILNCYQHALTASSSGARQDFWQQLTHRLQLLPKRNMLLLTGDFNTTLCQTSSAVGHATFSYQNQRIVGSKHDDWQMFHNILTSHGLIALNTWNSHLGATYSFRHQHSRIDYMCVKQHHADTVAKDIMYLTEMPLLPTGARHLPLVSHLRLRWIPMNRTPKAGWTFGQRQHLCDQIRGSNDLVLQIQHDMTQHLTHLCADELLDDFSSFHPSFLQSFSPPKPSSSLSQADVDLTPLRQFLTHARHLQQLRSPSLQNCFHAWTHVIRRDLLRRSLRRHSCERRRMERQAIFEAAATAEASHDSYGMFQAIRSIAPKCIRKRVQLRAPNGALLSPAQAADSIAAYISDLYHGDNITPESTCFAWPYSPDEVSDELSQLPARKALDPACLPAPYWKHSNEVISDFMHPLLSAWCESDDRSFPIAWGGGHLTFLPKPGKACRQASDLRPIALLEPLSKITMGLIAKTLRSQVQDQLCRLPQFAYQPGRGCTDAILRLSIHCAAVIDLLSFPRYPIHARAQGISLPQLQGGVLLSLDLSKAFDKVPRAALYASFQRLGIPTSLINLIASIYSCTHFTFTHRGETRTVQTGRGIRQGCKAAPTFWCSFVAAMLLTYAERTFPEWITLCTTVFADDICLHSAFHSLSNLAHVLERFGCLLDLLQELGMEVNLTKTVALIRMTGKQLNRANQRFLHRTKEGVFLRIPRRTCTTMIRIVSHQTYLGISLSYRNPASQSMNIRLAASKKASILLHKWLFCKHAFSRRGRLRLWRQCVFSCLTYGLFHIGFTTHDLIRLRGFCLRQLRMIFHEPAHVTHVDNFQFLHQHRLLDPLVQFRSVCQQWYERHHLRVSQLLPEDILHTLDPSFLAHRLDLLDTLITHLHSQDQPSASAFPASAGSPQHGPGKLRVRDMTMAASGLPTCVHCSQHFTTWDRFYHHVEFVCPMTSWCAQVPDEVDQRQAMLLDVLLTSPDRMQEHSDLQQHLLTHCCLCDRFCSNSISLLRHWSQDHADVYAGHGRYMPHLLESSTRSDPCLQCGQPGEPRHNCVVLRQMAMASSSLDLPVQAVDAPGFEDSLLPCRFCSKTFITSHGRKQHEDNAHKMKSPTTIPPDMKRLCHDAVEQDNCDLLFPCKPLLQALNHECALCGFQSARRNSLTRHFRQAHADLWPTVETMLLDLVPRYQPHHDCHCDPPSTQKRHQCMVYLQFALLRTHMMMTQPPAHPPSTVIDDDPPLPSTPTADHVVRHALRLGLISQVLHSDDLAYDLLHCCILCSASFVEEFDLVMHLRNSHPDEWTNSWNRADILQQAYTATPSCLCIKNLNAPDPDHRCPGFRQVAIASYQVDMAVLVPERLHRHHLCHLLTAILTMEQIEYLYMLVQTCAYHDLIHLPWLHLVLSGYCLLCQQHVEPTEMQAHLAFDHTREEQMIQSIRWDICQNLNMPSSPDMCTLCGGEHHWVYGQMDDYEPTQVHYIASCAVTAQLAVLLLAPILLKDMTLPAPPPSLKPQMQQTIGDALNAAVRRHQKPPLELLMNMIAHLLTLHETATHFARTCLVCGCLFFNAHALILHLYRHRISKMWFAFYLHQLASFRHAAVAQCSATRHLKDRLTCPILVNLCVLLSHSHGRTRRALHRSAASNLATCTSSGGTQTSHLWISAEFQKTKRARYTRGPADCASAGESLGSQARGCDQHSVDRKPVCDSLSNWSRVHCSAVDGKESTMASRSSQVGTSSTHPCEGDDSGASLPIDSPGTEMQCGRHQSGGSNAGGASVDRQPSDAVPLLEQQGEEAGGISGGYIASGTGSHCAGANLGLDGEQANHDEVPWPEEDGLCHSAETHLDPICVADLKQGESGFVAESTFTVLSLHLAAHQSPGETPFGQSQPRSATAAQGHSLKVIRLLLNTTGTACFANAVVQALAWIAVVGNYIHTEFWEAGLAFMKLFTTPSPLPLNLRKVAEFQSLLQGEWTVDDLLVQQDCNEFCQFFLNQLKPHFIHCGWEPLAVHRGFHLDERAGEKGSQRFPLRLNLKQCQHHAPTLQTLINDWFDTWGLRRCLVCHSPGLCIQIDRGSEQGMCDTPIHFLDRDFTVPVYDSIAQQVRFPTYCVKALIIHTGNTMQSGHYRACLRTDSHWYIYDDNVLPVKLQTWSMPRGYRLATVWAVLHEAHRNQLHQ
eukprot:Skav228314  [mRNA]  locus=scaffold3685:30397:36963:- [translate_table: standard]